MKHSRHHEPRSAGWDFGLVAVAAACLVILCATGANAGANLLLTPVADLGALPFSSESGLGAPPASNDWVSYILGVSTDDGSKIQAIDVNLKGTFGQRWNWDVDAGSFAATPSSLSTAGGDSHLMLPTSALSAISPTEDIGLLAPPASIAGAPNSQSYGVGSTMRGVWGVPGIENGMTSMNLAYLVMPRGSESQLEYAIDGFDGLGNSLFQFRQGASFPPPPPPAPSPPAAIPPTQPPLATAEPPLVTQPVLDQPPSPPFTPNLPEPLKPPTAASDPQFQTTGADAGEVEAPVDADGQPTLIIVSLPDGQFVPMPIWNVPTLTVKEVVFPPRYFVDDSGVYLAGNPATDSSDGGSFSGFVTFFSQSTHNAPNSLSVLLQGRSQTGLVAVSALGQLSALGQYEPVAMAGAEPTGTPEPTSIALAGIALIGLIALARRRF